MSKKLFITTEEVASEHRVSQSYTYKMVREMNKQLKQNDFLVIMIEMWIARETALYLYKEIFKRD